MPQHPVRIETKSLPKPWPRAPGLSRRAALVTLDLAADRRRKNAEYEFVHREKRYDVEVDERSRTKEAAQHRNYDFDTFDSRVYEQGSTDGELADDRYENLKRLSSEKILGGAGSKKALGNDGPVFYSFGEVASNGDRESHVSDTESTDGLEDERLEGIHSPYIQGEALANGSQHGPTAYHVIESRYAGDGYADGHHSAKLTAILSERAAISQSMFRWIIETAGLQDMLTSIKRDNATTVQVSDGKYVRCLEPGLRHDSLTLDGKVLGSRSVTWISLPYFSLEPYSGLLSGSSTKGFPTPTLLQAKYPRTIRSRDMEQAVCQQKGVPKGNCFHVSQLWCLILDNTLLLTYGRLTEKALCEDIITINIKPLPTSSAAMTDKKLLVRYQGTMMWSIPVQQCQTWFVRFSPVKLPDSEVLLSSLVGDEALHSAQQAPGSAAQVWEQAPSPVHLAPLPGKGDYAPAASQTRRPGGETRTSFGIFAYLDLSKRFGKGSTTAPVRPTSSEENNLEKYFDEIQDYIRTKTLPGDRHAYDSVRKLKRSAVHELLDIERRLYYEEYPSGYQRDFDLRVSFFHAAEALFDFFFPKNTLVPTTRRFWGAVWHLVDYDIATKPPDRKIDHELRLLDQELSIIDWILELQIRIINQFLVTREHLSRVSEETFGEANEVDQGELPGANNVPQPVRWAHESPSQQTTLASMAESILAQTSNPRPSGFSHLFLDHCVKELYRKQRDVQGISDAAANMAATNRTRINQTKDRQERAIYAFTMVTVIFLPLSAVASIFGMNSSDIRDMDLGQWAYWATAVPVTAVVMLLGLLVTGELGNAWWWLEQRVGAWLGRRSALQSLRRARDRRERRAQREKKGSGASTFDDELT
ncbi:hypothetical protein C7999DRAFT_15548 [Corynascus novoguineensis]|uniref:Uncharacterized protein n=1 Tax=Corynascus novoguineensis TaxID=1126955 RepID=A0AAN7CS68_9PEZI|nr:hypothetical protein C7999DRAFT_15548 [Corynascus novoguineensis]